MEHAFDRSLVSRIRECPVLARMSEDDLRLVLAEAVHETRKAGDILFHQGDPAERFFIVLEGRVVLYLDPQGDLSSIARIVGPGDTFAEAAICGQGTYPVTAEAITPTELMAIPGAPLCRVLENRFDLVMFMLGEMSLRLRGLLRQITDLKMKTTSQRLATYLLGLTCARSGPAEIRLPYGKKLLASELGMKPETLSRAFLKIQPLGVRYHKQHDVLRISDVAALGSFCQNGGSDDDD